MGIHSNAVPSKSYPKKKERKKKKPTPDLARNNFFARQCILKIPFIQLHSGGTCLLDDLWKEKKMSLITICMFISKHITLLQSKWKGNSSC